MYFKHVRCNEEQQKDTFAMLRDLITSRPSSEAVQSETRAPLFHVGKDLLSGTISHVLCY